MGPDGERRYEITDAEVRQARALREMTNTAREGRRQISKALAVAGVILLGAAGLNARAGATRDSSGPKQS